MRSKNQVFRFGLILLWFRNPTERYYFKVSSVSKVPQCSDMVLVSAASPICPLKEVSTSDLPLGFTLYNPLS